MKYKRRIIYIDDETWGELIDTAASNQTTISGTIRDLLYRPLQGQKIMRESMVHHLDGDPSNLDLDNLELVPKR